MSDKYTAEQMEAAAASVDSAWCKNDPLVRAPRCHLAANMLRQAAQMMRERDARDAERYRWLRDMSNRKPGRVNITTGYNDGESYCLWNEEMDAAIDTHITAHAQMVEQVREVIADMLADSFDMPVTADAWADKLAAAIGDAK